MSSDQTEALLAGSCACGKIKYSSSSLPQATVLCHCVSCRKMSGDPYMTFLQFPKADITWLGNSADFIKQVHLSDTGTRTMCADCGSHLYMSVDSYPDTISMLIGSIDEDSVKGELPKTERHIFVDQKMKWYEIADDAPQYYRFSERRM